MKASIALGALVSAGLFVSAPATAAHIYWTDWNSSELLDEITGVIEVGGESVGVTFNGDWWGAQVASPGTNYWGPSTTYTSSEVDNAPPTDIVQLNSGGEFTITFSRPVVDPVFALASWGDATVDFGAPIRILSSGVGYWADEVLGTPVLSVAGTGFSVADVVNGVVGLTGQYSAIRVSQTLAQADLHGLTVGIRDVVRDPTQVPAPAPLLLLGLGAFLLGSFSTRRA